MKNICVQEERPAALREASPCPPSMPISCTPLPGLQASGAEADTQQQIPHGGAAPSMHTAHTVHMCMLALPSLHSVLIGTAWTQLEGTACPRQQLPHRRTCCRQACSYMRLHPAAPSPAHYLGWWCPPPAAAASAALTPRRSTEAAGHRVRWDRRTRAGRRTTRWTPGRGHVQEQRAMACISRNGDGRCASTQQSAARGRAAAAACLSV